MSSSESEALKAMIDVLRMYTQSLNIIADVEERSGKKFDELLRELFNPTRLAELGQRLPRDVYGEFMASLFRLISIFSTAQNPMTLPISEKKRVSSEVSKIVESMEKAAEGLEAR